VIAFVTVSISPEFEEVAKALKKKEGTEEQKERKRKTMRWRNRNRKGSK
jgi:hypothetical protein